MRIIYLLSLLLIIFISCKKGNKTPKEIIDRPHMQELMWDMLRADVFLIDYAGKGDTAFNRSKESILFYQRVLALHNTSKDEFKKSLNWYQQHPDEMKVILDTLQARQNNIVLEQNKIIADPKTDTIQKVQGKSVADTIKNPRTQTRPLRKTDSKLKLIDSVRKLKARPL
jgi:hypothetical protein